MVQEFFDSLKKHSNAKIEILDNYYIPWLRKITMGRFNSNRCLVIDGFAGPGIYEEDGAKGSPIKLIEGAIDYYIQCEQNSWDLPSITIILIEAKAENHKALIRNIEKLFSVEYDANGRMILSDYSTINIVAYNDSFENKFEFLLNQVENGQTLIPSFCFVDPFGFSHTPFKLFKKYLENSKAEILFNFMYEEINRFILSNRDTKLIETYENLFGVSDLGELRSQIVDKSAVIRKETIINYYSKQLLEKTDAQYVLNFEFKKSGRTKMFLIHSTKNIKGLALMKDVMWKLDETGAFLYDDRKDDNQIQFEFFDEYTKKEHINKLANIIYDEFKGMNRIDLQTIEDFVLKDTIYPSINYFKPAMKFLEKEKLINVRRRENARTGTFNERTLYVSF